MVPPTVSRSFLQIKLIQVIPADAQKPDVDPSDSKLHVHVPLPNPLMLEHSVKGSGECVLEHHIRSLNRNQNVNNIDFSKSLRFHLFYR